MLNKVLATVISVLILLVLDAAYIYAIKDGYMAMVKHIQGVNVQINIYAFVLAYIFVVTGLVLYVLPYAEKIKLTMNRVDGLTVFNKLYIAVVAGALFGAFVYGIYNATNMALFKHFSISFALFDMVWGSFLYFIATFVYLLIVK
jgi:uncharacterized membrane protein